MRILQLCKKFPHPPKDGESIAVQALSRGLNKCGAHIDLLAFNTTKHWVDVTPKMTTELSQYDHIFWIELDNQVKPMELFFNLFSSESYNISRFIDDRFEALLLTQLDSHSYDVVIIESVYMMPYVNQIRQHSNAHVVLRAHNVEFEIWQRMAESSDKTFHRWYFEYCAKKLKHYELDILDEVDLIVPITSIDESKLLTYKPGLNSQVIPVGLECDHYDRDSLNTDPYNLAFVGSLDWMPNLEGLNWFVDGVMPLLRKQNDNFTLSIAGRNCPEWLESNPEEGIHVFGEIDDAIHYMNQYVILVVPLFSGSGIRVKILEAMALGMVVITTDIGIEGIDAEEEVHYLKANSVDEFSNAIQSIIANPRRLKQISLAAKKLISTNYSQLVLGQNLYKHLSELKVAKV